METENGRTSQSLNRWLNILLACLAIFALASIVLGR